MAHFQKSSKILFLFCLIFILLLITACNPGSLEPPPVTRETEPTAEPAESSWCQGGFELKSTQDAGCYLESLDPPEVHRIDEETAVLFPPAEMVENWAGAAILYNQKTHSMLVFDKFGDVLPQASQFNSRPGAAVFESLSGDKEIMAGLKAEIQERWGTTASGQPEIRLGTAWQDGRTTIFLIATAGLESDDPRFYCPSQMWTIGDIRVAIEAECIVHEPGTLVSQFFFQSQEIDGQESRMAQIALDGVQSNTVMVSEIEMSLETAVYTAILEQLTNRSIVLRGETASGYVEDAAQPPDSISQTLWQDYLAINETPVSLRFLFQNSGNYFIQPNEVIRRDYLPEGELQYACVYFRAQYTGLAGVATLSQIALNDNGSQALVHAAFECGTADRQVAYYILEKTGDGWQVANTLLAADALPSLTPVLEYNGETGGCGDIFIYKSTADRSEFITIYVSAAEFEFSQEPVTLNIADYPESIFVRIEIYSDSVEALGQFPYCNDIAPAAQPQTVARAGSGQITVSITAEEPITNTCAKSYPATIVLVGIEFDINGELFHLPSMTFEEVEVGWCAG